MEELGAVDMAMAVSLSVHILSPVPGRDLRHGRAASSLVAGDAVRGEVLGAFALTEPHAGSDAAALRTRAVRRRRSTID